MGCRPVTERNRPPYLHGIRRLRAQRKRLQSVGDNWNRARYKHYGVLPERLTRGYTQASAEMRYQLAHLIGEFGPCRMERKPGPGGEFILL